MAYTWGQSGTTTKVRVPGGGNTYFKAFLNGELGNGTNNYAVGDQSSGNPYLEFMSDYTDTPGAARGQTTPIHPIGSPYPVEIATPYAQQAGTLQLRFWQQWGEDGWVSALEGTGIYRRNNDLERLADSPYGFAKATLSSDTSKPVDLYQVLRAQRAAGGQIGIQKFELGGNGSLSRVKTYWGAVITDIQQPESNVSTDTMTVMCTISIMYCFSSWYYCNGSGAAVNKTYLV